MKFRDAIVIGALSATIVLGLLLGIERVHNLMTAKAVRGPFEWIPFAISAAMIIFPALAIQKGDIGTAFKVVKDNAPVLSFGRRSYDNKLVVMEDAENRVADESADSVGTDRKSEVKRSEPASPPVSGKDYEDNGIL